MKISILLFSLFAANSAHAESCVRFKKCYKVISEKGGKEFAARYGFYKGSTFLFDQTHCDSVKFSSLTNGEFDETTWKLDGKCHHDGEGRTTIDDEKITNYGYSDAVCPSLKDQPNSEIVKGKDGKVTISYFDSEGGVVAQGLMEPTDVAPDWMSAPFHCN